MMLGDKKLSLNNTNHTIKNVPEVNINNVSINIETVVANSNDEGSESSNATYVNLRDDVIIPKHIAIYAKVHVPTLQNGEVDLFEPPVKKHRELEYGSSIDVVKDQKVWLQVVNLGNRDRK